MNIKSLIKIKTFCGGYDRNFTYVLYSENHAECCVLDPAVPAQEVISFIEKEHLIPKFVLFLHSHFDHIVELDVYRKAGIPIYGHEATRVPVDKAVKDGEIIQIEGISLKILHTPGHRYDCICVLVDEKHLFTSDTLFVEGYGRVDLPGSDPVLMKKTLEKLRQLPDNIIVYPGHDYGSTVTSTIGKEKKINPFLG